MKWVLILAGMFLGAEFGYAAVAIPQNVRLAWNPNSDPNVAGYRVYYGVASRTYTQMVDAGNATGVTIPNLTPGVTYYFAATSYDVVGLESMFSTEISYTPVVSTLARLQIRAPSGSPAILSGTGLAGHIYEIQATTNLANWNSLGNVTAGSNGLFQYTDPNATNFYRRYYRVRDTQP